jgi:hypothetical protein
MAAGYRWIKAQLSDEVYETARQLKGNMSWDDFIAKLIVGKPIKHTVQPVTPKPPEAQPTPPEDDDEDDRPPTRQTKDASDLLASVAKLRGVVR